MDGLGRVKGNGQGRNRTGDTRIFSPLLYQLSYLSNIVAASSHTTSRYCSGRRWPVNARPPVPETSQDRGRRPASEAIASVPPATTRNTITAAQNGLGPQP